MNSSNENTIGKCLLEACYGQDGNQPAFVTLSNTTSDIFTYQQVWRVLSDYYFHWWQPQLAVPMKKKKKMLAFLCDNDANIWLHYCTVLSSSHYRIVLLNTRWTALEMAQSLLSSNEQYNEILLFYNNKANESKAQICQAHLNQLSSATMTMNIAIISLPNYLDKTNLSSGKGSQTNTNTISSCSSSCGRNRDDAVILFTSGTSSNQPKGVRLSHASLHKQAMAKPWGAFHQKYLLASSTPWFHIGGLSSALSIFLQGGTFVFATTPNISYNTILPNVNIMVLVPAMIHNILTSLQNNQEQQHCYEHIQVILVGGSSLSTQQRMKCRQIFPNARIIQTYACTEAGSSMTFYDITHTVKGDSTKYGGGIPVGIPHVDLKINDNGVIATRGIHVMNGYWNSTSYTKENEWYNTSDLGYLDQKTGMLYYCGRNDDVIRTGSESVVAFEVEQYLQSLLDNRTVVVIPLPHDKYGQMICAVLQNDDDDSTYDKQPVQELSPLQFLQIKQQWKSLASYKFPKCIFCMNQFPRNSNGKILKRKMIPMIQKYIQQQQEKRPFLISKL